MSTGDQPEAVSKLTSKFGRVYSCDAGYIIEKIMHNETIINDILPHVKLNQSDIDNLLLSSIQIGIPKVFEYLIVNCKASLNFESIISVFHSLKIFKDNHFDIIEYFIPKFTLEQTLEVKDNLDYTKLCTQHKIYIDDYFKNKIIEKTIMGTTNLEKKLEEASNKNKEIEAKYNLLLEEADMKNKEIGAKYIELQGKMDKMKEALSL